MIEPFYPREIVFETFDPFSFSLKILFNPFMPRTIFFRKIFVNPTYFGQMAFSGLSNYRKINFSQEIWFFGVGRFRPIWVNSYRLIHLLPPVAE
jgi:hypothetical protein